MQEIKCFACEYPFLKETAAGEIDRWGSGPYIDLSAPALGGLTIRLYYSGQEDRKAGIICPICGMVVYISIENLREKVPLGWPKDKPFPYPSKEEAEEAVGRGEEELRKSAEKRAREDKGASPKI